MNTFTTFEEHLQGIKQIFLEDVVAEFESVQGRIGCALDISLDEENLEVAIESCDATLNVRCLLAMVQVKDAINFELYHSQGHSGHISFAMEPVKDVPELTVERVVNVIVQFLEGQTLPAKAA